MVTIAIQAGGRSTRMGRNKALLKLAGKPLIQHVIDGVGELGDEILITAYRPSDFTNLGVRTISDVHPGAGALGGLQTSLQFAVGETVLVLACDMPFLCRPLLQYLLDQASSADVVIPMLKGQYEPLHAVYDRSCLPYVERALAAGERRLVSFFPFVDVLPVGQDVLQRFDPQAQSFFNINSWQDLRRAEAILAGG